MHDLKGREGSPSEKLFEHLGAEKTGVRYVKKVVSLEERPELAQSNSFSNLDQVVGVCAGDYDGDDHPDLFFSYPYGGHRLFRNLGGFRFEDPTEAAGLLKVVGNHWAVGCSFVDYDGDGDLDLFVAGVGDPNLLLENQGDGTFQDRAGCSGPPVPGMMASEMESRLRWARLSG
ncbi:MAG: FG-GAP-like repeat-containing protein [Akkermansiaceae bacterium]